MAGSFGRGKPKQAQRGGGGGGKRSGAAAKHANKQRSRGKAAGDADSSVGKGSRNDGATASPANPQGGKPGRKGAAAVKGKAPAAGAGRPAAPAGKKAKSKEPKDRVDLPPSLLQADEDDDEDLDDDEEMLGINEEDEDDLGAEDFTQYANFLMGLSADELSKRKQKDKGPTVPRPNAKKRKLQEEDDNDEDEDEEHEDADDDGDEVMAEDGDDDDDDDEDEDDDDDDDDLVSVDYDEDDDDEEAGMDEDEEEDEAAPAKHKLSKKQTEAKEQEDQEAMEERYESRLDKIKEKVQEEERSAGRLPIKGRDGVLRAPDRELEKPEFNPEEDDEEAMAAEEEKRQEAERKAAAAARQAARAEVEQAEIASQFPDTPAGRKAQVKHTMAALSLKIVEDPEKNVASLNDLRTLTSKQTDMVLCKLGILTQLAVYKDIIPGYRIRELTEEEKNEKISKDVKKLRDFEQTLIVNYQKYLQALESHLLAADNLARLTRKNKAKKKPVDVPDRKKIEGLALVAAKCMADLLASKAHFNFRSNLINSIVARSFAHAPPGLTDSLSSQITQQLAELCCQSIEGIFKLDDVGEVSLEVVKLLTQQIKTRSYKVQTRTLDTLLHLRLTSIVSAADVENTYAQAEKDKKKKGKGKKDEKHVSKRQKKLNKEDQELERDMKEADAETDKQTKKKLQSDILKIIFLTYFRILKNTRNSPLLPSTLRGLSVFAHLINVDFFGDLLAVIRTMVADHNLDLVSGFQCILTVFQLMTGQGEALNVDLKHFYEFLYKLILDLPFADSKALRVGIECLEHALFGQKGIPWERVCAFAKRLLTVAVLLPAPAVLAIEAVILDLLGRYPKSRRLFDTDVAGVYRPTLDDPDLCQASAALLWETVLLKDHAHQGVAQLSKYLSQGRGEIWGKPVQIFDAYSAMELNPEIPRPPRRAITKPDPAVEDPKVPWSLIPGRPARDSAWYRRVRKALTLMGESEFDDGDEEEGDDWDIDIDDLMELEDEEAEEEDEDDDDDEEDEEDDE